MIYMWSSAHGQTNEMHVERVACIQKKNGSSSRSSRRDKNTFLLQNRKTMLSSRPLSSTQPLQRRPFTTTTVSTDSPQLSLALSPPPPPPPHPPAAAAYNPSFLIIAAILIFVVLFSAVIHHLLRLLSHSSSSSSSNSSTSTTSSSSSAPPFVYHNSTTSTSSSLSPEMEPRTLSVDSLPLLSLAAVAATKSYSPDCAVCLSRFRPGDQLRLLPDCRHVFHSPCIEAWLRSPASSCPLCRSPIRIPSPLPPPSPPPQPPGDANVSVAAPGDEVAEAAGEDGRGWLKDYVDRLASSASSSFSSFRFSGRWSRRFDDTGEASFDLEDGGDRGAASRRWTLRSGAAS